MGWLAESYSHFGWNDPFPWLILEKTNIPRQNHTSDCGVFALAFSSPYVHCLPIAFMQSDMRYFRSKIVVEIFKRSWQLNTNRLGLTHLAAFPWTGVWTFHRKGLTFVVVVVCFYFSFFLVWCTFSSCECLWVVTNYEDVLYCVAVCF